MHCVHLQVRDSSSLEKRIMCQMMKIKTTKGLSDLGRLSDLVDVALLALHSTPKSNVIDV